MRNLEEDPSGIVLVALEPNQEKMDCGLTPFIMTFVVSHLFLLLLWLVVDFHFFVLVPFPCPVDQLSTCVYIS
jgi:hypothetical protein